MMLQMAKKMKRKWLAPIWPHERVKTKENGSTKPFSDVTSSGDEGSRPFIVIIPFVYAVKLILISFM